MRPKPKIFIPEEGNNTLKEVLLERYDNFDIYWYHWPEDGSLFWVEDYEPVIILYKGVEICLGLTQLKFLRYARPYLGRNSSQIRRVPCDTRAMKECFEIPELPANFT
jgi:hypothetical protein